MQPNDAIEKARAKLQSGDRHGALQGLQQALPFIADDPVQLSSAGYLLFEASEFSAGVSCVRRAVKLAPESATAHHSCFDLLWIMGRRREALEHLRICVALDPEDAPTLRRAVHLFADAGCFSDALKALIALRNLGDLETTDSEVAIASMVQNEEVLGEWELGLRNANRGMEQWALAAWLFRVGRLLEPGCPDHESQSFYRALATGVIPDSVPVEAPKSTLRLCEILALREVRNWSGLIAACPERNGAFGVWRAEAERLSGLHREALESLRCVEMEWGVLPLGGKLNRALAEFEVADWDGQYRPEAAPYRALVEELTFLYPEWDGEWDGTVRFMRHLFADALIKLGGSREMPGTFVQNSNGSPRIEAVPDSSWEWARDLKVAMKSVWGLDRNSAERVFGTLPENTPGLAQSRFEMALRLGHAEGGHPWIDEGLREGVIPELLAEFWIQVKQPARVLEVDWDAACPANRLRKATAHWMLGSHGEASRALAGMEGMESSLRHGLLQALLSPRSRDRWTELLRRFPVTQPWIGKSPESAEGGAAALLSRLTVGGLTNFESIWNEGPHPLGVLLNPLIR